MTTFNDLPRELQILIIGKVKKSIELENKENLQYHIDRFEKYTNNGKNSFLEFSYSFKEYIYEDRIVYYPPSIFYLFLTNIAMVKYMQKYPNYLKSLGLKIV